MQGVSISESNSKGKESFIDTLRIKSDINGNPRIVVHFLAFIKPTDKRDQSFGGGLYELALKRARRVGGKRFHNKQFGGGIVFQSYSDTELQGLIQQALNGEV